MAARNEERQAQNSQVVSAFQVRKDPANVELLRRNAVLEAELREARATIARLEREGNIDPITGTLNRAGLELAMTSEWNRCGVGRQAISVIFVDLDGFKAINDTFDHSTGDAALAAVGAQLVRSMRRSGEVVGRYGGDEFIAISPQSTLADASVLAERIRQSVAAIQLPVGQKTVHMTVSVGFASAMPHSDARGMKALIAEADAALKEAKAGGKNRSIAMLDGKPVQAVSDRPVAVPDRRRGR